MTALSKRPRDADAASDLRLDLDRDPQAPSLARAAVAGFCERDELDGTQASTLALLVSELVSNAVLHSQAPPASGICARGGDRPRRWLHGGPTRPGAVTWRLWPVPGGPAGQPLGRGPGGGHARMV
jgi:hypothetical protein